MMHPKTCSQPLRGVACGKLTAILSAASLCFILSACGVTRDENQEFPGQSPYNSPTFQAPEGSLLGEGGLSLFGGDGGSGGQGGAGAGLGVNAFLWRASLDTIAFMPISSADPFGGVIITDWFSPSGVEDERFKLNVFILDRQLRADGLRVAVFRETRTGPNGDWRAADIPADTATGLENAILTRARQLRVTQQAAGN